MPYPQDRTYDLILVDLYPSICVSSVVLVEDVLEDIKTSGKIRDIIKEVKVKYASNEVSANSNTHATCKTYKFTLFMP